MKKISLLGYILVIFTFLSCGESETLKYMNMSFDKFNAFSNGLTEDKLDQSKLVDEWTKKNNLKIENLDIKFGSPVSKFSFKDSTQSKYGKFLFIDLESPHLSNEEKKHFKNLYKKIFIDRNYLIPGGKRNIDLQRVGNLLNPNYSAWRSDNCRYNVDFDMISSDLLRQYPPSVSEFFKFFRKFKQSNPLEKNNVLRNTRSKDLFYRMHYEMTLENWVENIIINYPELSYIKQPLDENNSRKTIFDVYGKKREGNNIIENRLNSNLDLNIIYNLSSIVHQESYSDFVIDDNTFREKYGKRNRWVENYKGFIEGKDLFFDGVDPCIQGNLLYRANLIQKRFNSQPLDRNYYLYQIEDELNGNDIFKHRPYKFSSFVIIDDEGFFNINESSLSPKKKELIMNYFEENYGVKVDELVDVNKGIILNLKDGEREKIYERYKDTDWVNGTLDNPNSALKLNSDNTYSFSAKMFNTSHKGTWGVTSFGSIYLNSPNGRIYYNPYSSDELSSGKTVYKEINL